VVQVTRGGARGDEPFEDRGEPLPEPVRGRGLPVVEFGTVAQGEPGQEVVPVEPGRPVQRTSIRPGASVSKSVTSTRTRPGSRATAARVTRRPGPAAAAVTDNVRRSEARARVASASGQSNAASRSRLSS
jgi:hypothetical protein